MIVYVLHTVLCADDITKSYGESFQYILRTWLNI
jgi:hypothetical protein